MAFNHYAKMKRVLDEHTGWYVVRINKPTSTRAFNGNILTYDYYYRVIDSDGNAIKFCKFQQLDRFAQTMNLSIEEIPLLDS